MFFICRGSIQTDSYLTLNAAKNRLKSMQESYPEYKWEIKTQKDCVIDDILENRVYTPESGMIENLTKALNKLSLADLNGLLVIVKCKFNPYLVLKDVEEEKKA